MVGGLDGSTTAHAGMGLTCAQWLDARAGHPATKEIDNKASEAVFYLGGHVSALNHLDVWLARIAEPSGIQMVEKVDLEDELVAVERLCRGGLKQDALDVITLRNQAMMLLRTNEIMQIVEAYMQRGRQQGPR